MKNLIKAFFGCLVLNTVGYFVLSGLAPSASQMGMTGLSLMYSFFGFMLILGTDLYFIREVYRTLKKG